MGYPILGPPSRWGTPFLVDFWSKNESKLAPKWDQKSMFILCASRNPTSPSKTSSCTKVAQDGAKLVPNWLQKSTKNGVPHRTWGPKMGYPIGLWGQTFEKNRLKKATQQKRGRNLIPLPLLGRKSGQHGPNLATKIDQKSIKNRCKNLSFF